MRYIDCLKRYLMTVHLSYRAILPSYIVEEIVKSSGGARPYADFCSHTTIVT